VLLFGLRVFDVTVLVITSWCCICFYTACLS